MVRAANLKRGGLRPFVGRADELAALSSGLDQAQGGQSQLWLVVGEPGIGKTRLAEEVASRASRMGMRVLWGRCWEGEGAPPFLPWQQVVRVGLRGRTSDLIRQLGATDSGRAPLGQGGPATGEAFHQDVLVREPGARFRLFEAVTAWLRRCSRQRGALVILEDLHWADVPSVTLLRFVIREVVEARLLFLATFRGGEVTRGEPLSDALAELAREGRTLHLDGFKAVDTAALVAATAGFPVAPALLDSIQRRTEGNPLFVNELMQLLQARSLGSWDAGAVAQLPVVSGVRAAIHARLVRLSDPCKAVLGTAAVAGVEFDLDLVRRATDEDEAAVFAAIDEAAARQILQRLDSSGRRYRFTHALLRETLYEELASRERSARHERIADALEAGLSHGLPGRSLAALAYHFSRGERAADAVKAVEYGTRAADDARRLFAFEEAAALYAQALEALTRLPMSSTPTAACRQQECELLLALGEVQLLAAQTISSRATFTRAAELARTLDAPALLARAALGFAGGADVSVHVVVDAAQLLEEALARLGGSSPGLRASLLSRLAAAVLFTEAPERAAALSADALAEAQRAGDPANLAAVLGARRFVLLGPDHSAERQVLTERIVALAGQLGDKDLRCAAEFWRLLDALERGNGAAVDTHLARYTRLAESLRQPFLLWRSRVLRAMRLLLTGRFAEAEPAVQQALELGQGAQTPNAFLVYGAQRIELGLQQGRRAELQALEQQFAAAQAAMPAVGCGLALVRAHLGQLDAARADLGVFVTAGDVELPRDGLWLGAMSALAQVAVMLGERSAAAHLYQRLSTYAGASIVIGFGDLCHGAVARSLGLLAGTLGRWHESAAHFEAALTMNRALGARPMVAHVQREHAQMLLAAENTVAAGRAAALLRDAAATYRALGMTGFHEQTMALLAAASGAAATLRNGEQVLAGGVEPENRFRREAEYWFLAYEGAQARLKDRRGLHYIAQLLQEPGREFHVADLAAICSPPGRSSSGRRAAAGIAVPDARARAEYRERLSDLEHEAEEADRFNDPARAHQTRVEIEHLRAELAHRYRFRSDARERDPEIERIRKAAAKSIRAALTAVSAAHPALGRHLRTSIRTGTFCSYAPERPTSWRIG